MNLAAKRGIVDILGTNKMSLMTEKNDDDDDEQDIV